MLRHLALATVLATVPTLALAQSATPAAAVCDGSEIRHAEHVRAVGHTLFGATAVADLAAMLTIPHNPAGAKTAPSHFRFVAATSPLAIAGLFIAGRAAPGDGFWERVIARMKVGETKSADVRLCLQRPQVKTSNGVEERWTYVMARPVGLVAPSLNSLRLTFRDSVLAEVLTKEVDRSAMTGAGFNSTQRLDRHRGFCAPPIPVAADPFPTSMDTSAAAAAMARAQADADAAMKNSAAAAAYAACMVSDSAR